MTAELERLKTTCLAQEAEISRLQAGFDKLKSWVKENSWIEYGNYGDESEAVFSDDLLIEINRITGESK